MKALHFFFVVANKRFLDVTCPARMRRFCGDEDFVAGAVVAAIFCRKFIAIFRFFVGFFFFCGKLDFFFFFFQIWSSLCKMKHFHGKMSHFF